MSSRRAVLLMLALCFMWTGVECWGRRRRRRCDTHSCQWKWSECSKTCGGGTKYAIKTQEQGACGSCNMPSGHHPCNTQCCPENCYWSNWESWSSCSMLCGGTGSQTRTREAVGPVCGGTACQGSASETQDCYNGPCPVDCVWTSWDSWSTCSHTCGGGNQYRSRTHEVEAQHGGQQCVGESREDRVCNSQCCAVNCAWDNWGNWEECSVTCGQGIQLRQRGQTAVQSCGGSHCQGEAVETKDCDAGCCPANCTWSEWSDWSDCSKSCGTGSQARNRQRSVLDACGGIECVGPDEETKSCNEHCCVIDCQWGDWGEWGECSKSCDVGTYVRTRNVSVEESCGGDYCRGDDTDTEYCNGFCCEEHCHWHEWTSWGECSKTCGDGEQLRYRSVRIDQGCNVQRCPGLYHEERSCNDGCCAVDCELSDWSEWSECSAYCGGDGTWHRYKNITTEMQCGGKPCEDTSEVDKCNRFCFNNGVLDGTCHCGTGFEGDCCEIDINECDRIGTCPENSACFNEPGSYECVCNHNFTKEGELCVPMTACHWGTHDCHEKAQCVSVNENYICECEPGFTGSGTFCSDIDECKMEDEEIARMHEIGPDLDYADFASGSGGIKPTLCRDHASCHNTYGSYECKCDSGFEGNGTICTDIDECALLEMTPAHSSLYTSLMESGSGSGENPGVESGSGEMEQTPPPIVRCSGHATCKNSEGSYICSCNPGYHGNGFLCEDINECDSDPCQNDGECTNLINSFECTCKPGFTGLVCDVDVDECERDWTLCHIDATCSNTFGSYRCQCDFGYSGDGVNCSDVDECALPLLPEEEKEKILKNAGVTSVNEIRSDDLIYNPCHIHADCHNYDGGYYCKCKLHYTGNGYVCEDIDECELNYHNCNGEHEKCLNVDGKFECECEDGYEMKNGRCAEAEPEF